MADLLVFSRELYLLSAVLIVPLILPTCLSGAYLLSLSPVVDKTQTSFLCQTSWLFRVSCIYCLLYQSCHLYFQLVSQEPTFWIFHPVIDKTRASVWCQTSWLFWVSCIYFLLYQSCHLYFQLVSQEPTFWVFHRWSSNLSLRNLPFESFRSDQYNTN